MPIRQIPGLPLHPNQVAEKQRLEELKRTQPQLARQMVQAAETKKPTSLMPEPAREALKKVARAMRTASSGGVIESLSEPPASPPASAAPATAPAAAPPQQQAPPTAPRRDPATPRPKRAAGGGSSDAVAESARPSGIAR